MGRVRDGQPPHPRIIPCPGAEGAWQNVAGCWYDAGRVLLGVLAAAVDEEFPMSDVIWGIVKDGVIVPASPLPEGAQVEIHVHGVPPQAPPEVQRELEAWQLAGAEALELVERLAVEKEGNEKR
jgi:hypothetical protein